MSFDLPEYCQIQEISLQEVLPIRHSVLQFAEFSEASILNGDNDETTRHFGLYMDRKLAGVASLFAENLADRQKAGHRLRAMAVVEPMQRQGVGTALIKAIIYQASAANSDYLWCTVRPNTVDFYSRFGFEKDDVQIEMTHGTFFRMILTLEGLTKSQA